MINVTDTTQKGGGLLSTASLLTTLNLSHPRREVLPV
jgi:hypothetical protein